MIIPDIKKGFALPISIIFIGVSTGLVLSYFLWINNKNLNLKYRIAVTQALYNAETGIAESALPVLYSATLTQDTTLDGSLVNSEKYENKYFGNYEDHQVWFSDDGDRNAIYFTNSGSDTTGVDYDQHQKFGIKANGAINTGTSILVLSLIHI